MPGSAQRRKTLSKQGIATVQATGRAPESGPEYDLSTTSSRKPSFGFLKHKEGLWSPNTDNPRMFRVTLL